MIFYLSFTAALGSFTTLAKSKLRLGKSWLSCNATNKCGDLELMSHMIYSNWIVSIFRQYNGHCSCSEHNF